MSRSVVHSVDSCIADVVLGQLGHQTQRYEDRHFPDRSFTLQRPRSCWLHSCILSATFLTASSFAFLASLSGLVLGVQILDAPRALLLMDHLAWCSSLGPWCSRCFLQRHILHSIVCEDPPDVTWFEHPTEGYDSRRRSLLLFAAHVPSTMACLVLSRHLSL